MGRIWKLIYGLKAAMTMVMVQIAMAGVTVFYKLAANDGMSLPVLVAYRFIFAAAFVLPLALYFERKIRPKLTGMVVWQAFLCGLFGGSLSQNLYTESMVLTSATFASAMINLIPAITFIMAIFFRMESLGLGTMAGKAKFAGTFMGIGGAMLLTFYKGVEIKIWSIKVDLLHGGQHQDGHVTSSHQESIKHILGPLFSLMACFSGALSLIFQAKLSQRYPYHYSSTALICMMGSIQAVVFALCMERDWTKWKLGWNIRLLTIAYTGSVASGLMVILIMWCVHMRGPLYVSVFSPLQVVVVAIVASLLLNEKLHLGSMVGGVIIISGLYMVLWGKRKEIKSIAQLKSSTEQCNIVFSNSSSDNNNKNFLQMVDDDALD